MGDLGIPGFALHDGRRSGRRPTGPGSPAPGRRSCCSTGSRRRTTAGTRSRRRSPTGTRSWSATSRATARAASAPGGPLGEGYDKRTMAAELREVMARLGHERFSVVGHDRGGRVAYRMALDHPDAVERLAVLNIVPTVDQFERMAAEAALDYFPWYLLAQPRAVRRARRERERGVRGPSPARVVGRDPGRDHTGGGRPVRARVHRGGDLGHLRRVPRGVPSRPPDGRRGPRGRGADRAARCSCTGAPRRARCPTGRCSSGGGGPRTVEGGPLASGHFVPEEAADPLAARRWSGSSPPPASRTTTPPRSCRGRCAPGRSRMHRADQCVPSSPPVRGTSAPNVSPTP